MARCCNVSFHYNCVHLWLYMDIPGLNKILRMQLMSQVRLLNDDAQGGREETFRAGNEGRRLVASKGSMGMFKVGYSSTVAVGYNLVKSLATLPPEGCHLLDFDGTGKRGLAGLNVFIGGYKRARYIVGNIVALYVPSYIVFHQTNCSFQSVLCLMWNHANASLLWTTTRVESASRSAPLLRLFLWRELDCRNKGHNYHRSEKRLCI